MAAEPTHPTRLERSREYATLKHGTLTKNQKRVLWGVYAREAHGLSAGRAHQARRTLILRRLLDVDGRITEAGRELCKTMRKL
jgi:hypothetical protein